MTFGADRILFSVDYPFGNNLAAVAFLKNLPVSPDDREKIAHQKANALLRLRIPSRWNAIASRIAVSVSAGVLPGATQPGRSGTYAE
jgi:hypothetical protein